MLAITRDALQAMVAHAQRDYPNEACGYLAGRDGVVVTAFPMRNVDASPTSYTVDPLEQVANQRAIRQLGYEHMGIYHSHVATEALPSRRDIAHALLIQEFCSVPYWIVTLKGERPRVRAFTILDGHARGETVEEVAA